MKLNLLKSTSLFLIVCSCAGPTNPFGGQVLIGESFKIDKSFSPPKEINLKLSPEVQYYNSPYDLELSITDKNFDLKNFRYEISYNNKLLNRWMKSEEIILPQHKGGPVKIIFKNLSILPGNKNKISFLYYPANSKVPIIHELKVPECLKEDQNESLNISEFKIGKGLKDNIKAIAKKHNYNPSFIAALIAQESSFNPKALSFAKALGLTQVTPLAHTEIKRKGIDWKIHPLFKTSSFLTIKNQLKDEKINSKNDWRLDEKKSIEGGILYLNHIAKYWNHPTKKELLDKAFKNDIPKVDILLASYNSGAARVSRSIASHNKEWLFDDKLNEARKYVMNIKSYCYSFKKGKKDEK